MQTLSHPHPVATNIVVAPTTDTGIGRFRRCVATLGWGHWHWILPALAFFVANIALITWGGDLWIANHLYAWEGGHWALQDNLITSTVIHEAGRRLSMLAWVAVLVATILAFRNPRMTLWKGPLLRLCLSVLLATVIVALMKRLTHMDCPWDLANYGGRHPYRALFAPHPTNIKTSGCFPAGHAGAGYSWVALYFFFLSVKPQWRRIGLGIGLGAGLVFGFAQQLRGAHFLSHDVWTLMICWVTASLVYLLYAGSGTYDARRKNSAPAERPFPASKQSPRARAGNDLTWQ